MRRLLGYADRISVEPGETINFKVSSEDEGTFHGPVRSSLKACLSGCHPRPLHLGCSQSPE